MARFLPIVLAGLCIGIAPLSAVVPAAQARQQNPSGTDRLSDADLEEMLAPIALYPDPLLANVLAASVYPNQLAEAKSVVGNDAAIDAKDWEPSVKAIAKIPDAMTMLTEYPDWTKALGEAFILQSQDVMNAVQRLRARAQANGALQTTEQQVVQTQGDTIIIQPAQPNVIYVPTYSPQVVYVDHHDSGDVAAAGIIGFGLGVAAGAIIANNMDCNWYGGGCCYGCGWGGGYHGGSYNGGGNTNVKINTGGGDINIGSGNNNNVGSGNVNRPGQGEQWKPNQNKMSNSLREGKSESLGNYKNSGRAGANSNARIPNRQAGAQPIASRPAPRPSSTDRGGMGGNVKAPARPAAQPTQRPADMQARGSGPKASKPSIPPASARPPASNASRGGGGAGKSPSARPATPSTSSPSAFGGGGNSRQSASRGASSRSGGGGATRSSGGSRGGGGGRGGGGRR